MNIREDKMTTKERFEAYDKGQPIDRIICVPMVASNSAQLIGKTIKEFQLDPEVMANSLLAAYRKFKYDSVGICSNCSVLAEAMGAKLQYPEDDVASCDEPILKTKEDLNKIKIATPEDGNLWVFYEAAKICLREVGDDIQPTISVSGPFTTAATLRGVEAFARDTYTDPEFCHLLLRMSVESAKNHIKGIIKSGAAVGAICDPIASGSLISPKTFEKFVFPYLKELVDFIHELGGSAGIHICGKIDKILGRIADTGADLISVDKAELSLVKEVVKSGATIVGNISTTDEMLLGPVSRIHESCIKALETMKGYKGLYILSTSCDTSPNTPWKNIGAMMDIARSYEANYYTIEKE